MNPAVLEKLLNSIAQSFAPSISYMECGVSSVIKASYAASNNIIDLLAKA